MRMKNIRMILLLSLSLSSNNIFAQNEEVKQSLENLLKMIIKQVIADVRNELKNRNESKV